MKPKSFLRSLLFGSCCFLAVSPAGAADLYWDGGTVDIGTDGNGLGNGTTGNWNTTLLNWDQGANLAHVAWSGTTNTAVFGNTGITGNTVTLTDNITVGGLRFYSSTYTLATGANTLTLGGANNSITLFGTTALTAGAAITGTVAGTGNVILTSANPLVAATLTLNSTGNGWTGGTTVNAGGILSLANTSNALVNTSGITINGGTVTFAKNGTIGNQISDTATITFNGGGTFTQSNTTAGPHTETVGALTIATGQANIGITNGASSSGVVLTLGSVSRTAGTAAAAYIVNNTSQTSLKVASGAANTAANQIIGPWATFGSSATVQNDYAVYTGGDGTLAAANIAGSTENTWTNSTDSYTLNTGALTTLTGTRTINSLKFIGATSNLDLDNFNLQTYGVLWGGANANKNIIAGGTGALTTPTGGGNLFLTAGQNVSHTVSAPITNNGGNVTVVKSGVGTLVLSGTNTYSGGTVINAGTLSIGNVDHIGGATANLVFGGAGTLTATAALDFSSGGTLTVNQGAVATFTGNVAVKFASASGSGTLLANPSGNANFVDLGDASGFTGNLVARLTGNHNIGNTSNNQIQFTKLADTAGSLIQFVGGTSDSGQDMRVALYGNGGQLTFNNRQIQILPRTASNWNIEDNTLVNNNTNDAHTWVINTDLLMTSTSSTTGAGGVRYLTLSGTNAGDNAFNGLLPDGDNGSHPLGLRKTGSGKWIVSANNTFTGPVSVTGGTLVLSGTNQFTGSTTITSGGTLSVNSVSNYGVASAIGAASSGAILMGTGSGQTGTLEYTGSGHSTNRQIQVGSQNASSGNAVILNNGTGALTFTATTFNVPDPTAGGSSGSRNLTLGGDFTGGTNEIQGDILANTGAPTLRDIAIIKTGQSTWRLSGDNTYTKATTINAGVLEVVKMSDGLAASGIGASSNSAANLLIGSGATFRYVGSGDSTDRNFTINGTANGHNGIVDASGTGALVFTSTANLAWGTNNQSRFLQLTGTNTGDNTLSANLANNGSGAVNLTKNGTGKWVLTGTSTYTGATTVNDGTLVVGSTGSLAAASDVTVNNSATLVVNGTVGGTLVANSSTTISGTGTVAGNADIRGSHNPGNSPGIQTFGGDLSYTGGASTVNWELTDNSTGNQPNPNALFDQIIVGGNLDFTDLTTLNLVFNGGGSGVLWSDSFWNTDQSWLLYDVTGTTTNVSNLSLNTQNWFDSGSNAFNTARSGNSFTLSQTGEDVYLNYVVIPEPRAALLGGLGLLALLRRRR